MDEFGDGTVINHNIPIPVPGLTGVTAIAAGGAYSVLLEK